MEIIDRILLIASLDSASESNLKHSKLSEGPAHNEKPLCSAFWSLINIRNEKRRKKKRRRSRKLLSGATFQSVITVYK